MSFRDQRQRSEVCSALLARVGLEELWGPGGPDLVAQRRLQARMDEMPKDSAILMLTCWALWDGTGIAAVSDLFSLTGSNLCAVGELLRAVAEGPQEIDSWLERCTEPVSLSA